MRLRFDKLLQGEAGWRVGNGRGRACRIKSMVTASDRDLTAAAGSHQPSAAKLFCRVCTPPVTSSQLFTYRSQKFRTGPSVSVCSRIFACVCVEVREPEGASLCTFAKWWYKNCRVCVRWRIRDGEVLSATLCTVCVFASNTERNQFFVCQWDITFLLYMRVCVCVCVCVSCRPGFTLTET